jgi:hypothetical protein
MSFNEWGIILATVGVIIGVLLEGWEHWDDFKKKGWRPILPKLGFGILVVSLAIELVFDGRLAKESADTEKKAAQLEGELIEVGPRSVLLRGEYRAKLVSKLKVPEFAGQRVVTYACGVTILGAPIDTELRTVAKLLPPIFRDAGWNDQQKELENVGCTGAGEGIWIQIRGGASARTKKAGKFLVGVLNSLPMKAGGPVWGTIPDVRTEDADSVIVYVEGHPS